MKKMTMVLCLFISISNFSSAQSFKQGSQVLGVGIGLGSSLSYGSDASIRPAFSVNYEAGLWPAGKTGVISLGGYAGSSGAKYTGESGSYKWTQKWNYTVIGVRSAYHYTALNDDRFDVYGGLMLSYNISKYKYEDNDPSWDYTNSGYGSGMGLTGFVGGRYYFSKNIGAFAEVGYGVSYLTLGAAIKLK